MMNWEGFGRKHLCSDVKELSWHLSGETEENHEKSQPG
jgi:hypothetical protein